MLEGKNRNSTLNYFVIDYLRKFSGRKGSPGYTQRQNLEYAGAYEPQDHDRKFGNSDGADLDNRNTMLGLAARLEGREREIMMMYLDGDKMDVIGAFLNISESRVSQIISRSTEVIQDDCFVDELLSRNGLAKIKGLWNAK